MALAVHYIILRWNTNVNLKKLKALLNLVKFDFSVTAKI